MISWVSVITIVFAYSGDFLRDLGVVGRTDYWWWILLFGTAALSYYTAYGFLAMLKTIRLVWHLTKTKLRLDPYHEDGAGGLDIVAGFSVTVSWMFASGILFLPLMSKLAGDMDQLHDLAVASVVAVYLICIVLPFVYCVCAMHFKIVAEKVLVASSARDWLSNSYATAPDNGAADPRFIGWSLFHQNVAQVNNWPFNLKNGVSFVVSCALPVAYFLIKLWFEGSKFGGLTQ
jgi:hypothetical protein